MAFYPRLGCACTYSCDLTSKVCIVTSKKQGPSGNLCILGPPLRPIQLSQALVSVSCPVMHCKSSNDKYLALCGAGTHVALDLQLALHIKRYNRTNWAQRKQTCRSFDDPSLRVRHSPFLGSATILNRSSLSACLQSKPSEGRARHLRISFSCHSDYLGA